MKGPSSNWGVLAGFAAVMSHLSLAHESGVHIHDRERPEQGSTDATAITFVEPEYRLITLKGTGPAGLRVGNAVIDMGGARVAVTGTILRDNPNATIEASRTDVAGAYSGDAGIVHALPLRDPLDHLTPPVYDENIDQREPVSPLQPGVYKSMIVQGHRSLGSGTYVITEKLECQMGAALVGEGVTLYLGRSANCVIANNVTIDVSAPTSGSYEGVAIYVDPHNPNDISLGNHVTVTVRGTIYAPSADLELKNGASVAFRKCIVGTFSIRNGNVTVLPNRDE